MGLHPFGTFVEQVHLLSLFVVLFLHDGKNFIAFLALFNTLLVLISNQSKLVVNLFKLLIGLLLIAGLVLHICIVVCKVLTEQTIGLLVLLTHLGFLCLVLELNLRKLALQVVNFLLKCSYFLLVLIFKELVVLTADLVKVFELFLFVSIFAANGGLEVLNFILALLFLLF